MVEPIISDPVSICDGIVVSHSPDAISNHLRPRFWKRGTTMSPNQSSKVRFGLWYDFRNPPQWKQPSDRLYNEIIDQIVWCEQHGFDDVWLSEHHFIEDGYSPALLPLDSAIASRTKTIRIGTALMM